MQQFNQNSSGRARLHPLVAGAAVAVILASAAAIATSTGIFSRTTAPSQPVAQPLAAASDSACAPLAAASAPKRAAQPDSLAHARPHATAPVHQHATPASHPPVYSQSNPAPGRSAPVVPVMIVAPLPRPAPRAPTVIVGTLPPRPFP